MIIILFAPSLYPDANDDLFKAVRKRDIKGVKRALKKGANVNAFGVRHHDSGRTPLHVAAGIGDFVITKLLIENGADLNSVDKKGLTPFLQAIYSYRFGLAYLLLKKGADPMVLTRGKSLLFKKYISPKIAKVLIDKGIDLTVLDNEGNSALHHAFFEHNLDRAKLILKKITNVNIRNKKKQTPLHIIATGVIKRIPIGF